MACLAENRLEGSRDSGTEGTVVRARALVLLLALLLAGASWARAAAIASHPPTRPLPRAGNRPTGPGPARFVDAARGLDSGDGSEVRPWRTVARAARELEPGDTLYLRGGIYREAITLAVEGAEGAPITIRSYPGELAVIDRGIPEFYEDPAGAWVPGKGGARGEFVSVRAFPEIPAGSEDGTVVEGNFGDSMVPILGVRFLGDLRSDNPYGSTGSKVGEEVRIYGGPSVWYDPKTHKIHIRLAHTRLPGLEADGSNYKGETDPRKLRLVISASGRGNPLTLRRSRYLRLQDLVLRGGFGSEISVEYCAGIRLEGVTAYGGATVMNVRNTVGLRMLNCAFRGRSAPWVFRSHLKYRAIESSLVSSGGWDGGGNRDFEIAWSEFTDTIDGLFLGSVDGVNLHHCYLENFSDDGFFVTAPTLLDGRVIGGNITIAQSYIGRMLSTLAYGVGHGRQRLLHGDAQAVRTGAGVWVSRNVFDFRKWVYYFVPSGPEAPQEFTYAGRLGGDHGSPTWEPLFFYQNTVIAGNSSWRDHYAGGLGAMGVGAGIPRTLLNNIFVSAKGIPGWVLADGGASLVADGNLHWSWSLGAATDEAAFLARFRDTPASEKSKGTYAPGWTSSDRFADPRFFHFDPQPGTPLDLRVVAGSPAVMAGVRLPAECPDPLQPTQGEPPDIGAFPLDAEPWRVGVQGRYTAFGQLIGLTAPTSLTSPEVKLSAAERRPWRSAALVAGYRGFPVQALEFALEQAHFAVDGKNREWLRFADFTEYSVVACDGSLAVPSKDVTTLRKQDLARMEPWLEGGGTLVLSAGSLAVFHGPGERFLSSLGLRESPGKVAGFAPAVLEPGHAWVKHLQREAAPSGLRVEGLAPVECENAENVIGDPAGRSVLCRVPVGLGQIVYTGWAMRPLRDSRRPGELEQGARLAEERAFEDQVKVLVRIAESIAADPAE